jgi:hypothetical protein
MSNRQSSLNSRFDHEGHEDGISAADWDVVHGLTLRIVNATSIEGRATARSRLFAFLDELESQYGTLRSILAPDRSFRRFAIVSVIRAVAVVSGKLARPLLSR